MSSIRYIIFDLDDTLLDTSQLLIPIRQTEHFFDRIQQPLPLMPGASENLQYLSSKYNLYLLTQGQRQIQEQKITSLQIRQYFKSVDIVDGPDQTKTDYFAIFCEKLKCRPNEVLSVGNRRSTDIGPAKNQGFWTCWFAYGEHLTEPIQSPNEKPDFIIHDHFEMIIKCRL